MGYTGKYYPLKEYLESSKKTREELSYSRIEEILDLRLPDSASEYPEW